MPEASKTVLEINSIPRVNLAFMGKAHFETVERVKEIGGLINDYQATLAQDNALQDDEEKITIALLSWLQYSIAYFDAENALMQQTNFPTYRMHLQEHETALNRLKRILRLWQTDKDINLLADFIFTFWPNWFKAHINSMDIMTARHAVMKGYKP